jgi:hypothetical protein
MKCITRLSNISEGLSLAFLFFGLFIGSLSGCSSVLDARGGETIEKRIAELSAEVSLKNYEIDSNDNAKKVKCDSPGCNNGKKNGDGVIEFDCRKCKGTGFINPSDRNKGESGLVSALPETPEDPPENKTETKLEAIDPRGSSKKHNMSSTKKTGFFRKLFGGRSRSRSIRISGPPLSSTSSRRCLVG